MRPFQTLDDGSGSFLAALSTPERLVLAQVTGDVVELLGGEESFFAGVDDDDTLDGDPRDEDLLAAERDGEEGSSGAGPAREDQEDGEGDAGRDAAHDDGRLGASPDRQAHGHERGDDHGAHHGADHDADQRADHGDEQADDGDGLPGPAHADHPAHPSAAASETISAIREIFEGLEGAPVEPPVDPAVRRLLPDASSDPEVASEFRRFTDDDLRQHKVERLLLFADLLLEVPPSADEGDQLDFVVLSEEAQHIAGALADIRLVIGERLGLRTDRDSEELYDAVTATWEPAEDVDQGVDQDADPAREAADGSSRAASDGDPSRDRAGRGHAGEGMSGPRLFLGSVFLLAGYLQESLTECLLRDYRRGRRQP